MANHEVDYSTIRIKNNLRKTLDSFKIENESYSVVIANLIEENKQLKETVEYLKEDKDKLYKIILENEDSAALVNNVHKATYVITDVINNNKISSMEQLGQLKYYLNEMLENNPSDVLLTIDNLKDMLESDFEEVPEAVIEFEEYIKQNY